MEDFKSSGYIFKTSDDCGKEVILEKLGVSSEVPVTILKFFFFF
jgi:hypothetical protein